MDVTTLNEIQRLLDTLQIKYYKSDIHMVFKTKKDRNEAILQIWLSGWNKRNIFKKFMIKNNIFDLLYPEHILKKLFAI